MNERRMEWMNVNVNELTNNYKIWSNEATNEIEIVWLTFLAWVKQVHRVSVWRGTCAEPQTVGAGDAPGAIATNPVALVPDKCCGATMSERK